MATKLLMEHPNTGIMKQAPIGYSFTTLFFGPIPALLRGDVKWFFIMGIINSLVYITLIIFPIYYNKIYLQKLLIKGFKVVSAEGDSIENIKNRLNINLPMLEKNKEITDQS